MGASTEDAKEEALVRGGVLSLIVGVGVVGVTGVTVAGSGI